MDGESTKQSIFSSSPFTELKDVLFTKDVSNQSWWPVLGGPFPWFRTEQLQTGRACCWCWLGGPWSMEHKRSISYLAALFHFLDT